MGSVERVHASAASNESATSWSEAVTTQAAVRREGLAWPRSRESARAVVRRVPASAAAGT